MNIISVLPLFIAFVIVHVMGPILIPILRKRKADQTERKELKSHQVKNGTPTMGGIMILTAVTVTAAIYAYWNPNILPILFLTLGFGAIGFLDDFLKVILHRSDGLIAWQKFLLQIVVTTGFLIYIKNIFGISLAMRIPFMDGQTLYIGWIAFPLMYLAIIGTVNGVNFTDGVDGLASSVTLVVAIFFTMASVAVNGGITPITLAVVGALAGFLLFNCYPASIFMGDTGSLALGGFVAGAAYMLQMPLFILIVGLIYLIEVLSVMLQVTYFKITHGKRIFRMAPIHHHFELGGWSETRVVTVFTIITGLLCVIGYMAI